MVKRVPAPFGRAKGAPREGLTAGAWSAAMTLVPLRDRL